MTRFLQSVVGSATPADASKKEISDIKDELAKILDDEANDDMSYAGMVIAFAQSPLRVL